MSKSMSHVIHHTSNRKKTDITAGLFHYEINQIYFLMILCMEVPLSVVSFKV